MADHFTTKWRKIQLKGECLLEERKHLLRKVFSPISVNRISKNFLNVDEISVNISRIIYIVRHLKTCFMQVEMKAVFITFIDII